MADFSAHQLKIIGRYYDHREGIALNRLSEIVTDLMLADTDRRRNQLWKRAEQAMNTLKVPPSIKQHLLMTRDPQALARNLRGWLKQAPGKRADKSKS